MIKYYTTSNHPLEEIMDLKQYVSEVENWPKEGVQFKDITTIMDNGKAYGYAVDKIVEYAEPLNVDIVVGPEARGFIIGCPVAYKLGIGFAPVRKPGKLPRETVAFEYDLEYGQNILEMHRDAIKPGSRVLITDDLLATGGTVRATINLIEALGGVVVGMAFLIELSYLNGRDQLEGHDYISLIKYDE